MAQYGKDVLERLQATFRAEAHEQLRSMSAALDEWPPVPGAELPAALVERMFRDAHTLKGAARAVNRRDMEAVCQALENAFAALKRGAFVSTYELPESLREALDALGAMREAAAAAPLSAPVSALLRRIESAGKPGAGAHSDEASVAGPVERAAVHTVTPEQAQMALAAATGDGVVRIDVSRLDAMLREAEGLLTVRFAAAHRVEELREASAHAASIGRGAMASPALAHQLPERVERLLRDAQRDERMLASITSALLRQVREMHLLPVATLLERFPRMARELAREQAKKLEITIEGGDIELDRGILQALAEPLLHIVRNCVDHGIEPPAERERAGKAAQGRLGFSVAHREGGRIEIAVGDDGAGIRREAVAQAARRLGLPVLEDPAEPLALVFHSGLSTSTMLTDISGRGLGLAIVREKIERLGGRVTLESDPGRGSTFRILLPHALATYRGVLVRACGRPFVIPTTVVGRVARVPRATLRRVENRPSIALEGRAMAVVGLGELLGLPAASAADPDDPHLRVLVLGEGAQRIALTVDEVVGEQEVLVKALGPQLARVRNVAGACVIATGEVVPVLDATDLIESCRGFEPGPAARVAGTVPEPRRRAILVVEDSITARTLLTAMLASAGYQVSAAVDGMEGLAALRAGEFDLVVSDVEMPRMDGFDLTARIRADPRLAAVPVVLVTALGQREQRERGLEVGANAYLVKSDFEQSNLLEIVARLL
ncbi:MAG: response regulator [Betaproteobacteria bacterium]|nr:response regulator [Betaproteobacteria bacterium]